MEALREVCIFTFARGFSLQSTKDDAQNEARKEQGPRARTYSCSIMRCRHVKIIIHIGWPDADTQIRRPISKRSII